MTGYRTTRARAALVILACLLIAPALLAQSQSDVASLRASLRERYDILALQDGVALVPRQRSGIRLIEIRHGAVQVDSRDLTGRELRERLGADADLVVRVSYLSAADQRVLAEGAAPAPPPSAAEPSAAEPATPPAPPAPPATSERHRGDLVRIGGDAQVDEDETVDGDVAVVMGSATVNGHVTKDVSVVMGSLTLGPHAVVEGDVSTVGGSVSRAPGARVDGKVSNVGFGPRIGGWAVPGMMMMPFAWRLGSLAATVWRVIVVALLAMVALAAGRTWVEQIADHAAVNPWRAGLVGFFAEILIVPVLVITCVVLAVSIIGIPLLFLVPFAVLFLLVVLLIGFAGVAFQVGRLVNHRAGWVDRSPYVTVLVGVLVVAALTILARAAAVIGGGLIGFPLASVGYLVEYAAWTVGFGSAIQVLLYRRRRASLPPLPA